jgi:hypothetical protein
MYLLSIDSDGQPFLTPSRELGDQDYAVLSHTWEANQKEVTFKDILEKSGPKKTGYRKIEFSWRQANLDGLQYFWIDSCCIDRSSSAELSKAINSMFRWYRNAKKCYVYLTDVSTAEGAERNTWEMAFRHSRWFNRGWTLQELLAPRVVEFFSREGQRLGDKETLATLLHEVTKIPILALQGINLNRYDAEEKLRWAAKRETTEPEDKAYSLLGLFNVFIAPLYGEGQKHALHRLKEAIEQGT